MRPQPSSTQQYNFTQINRCIIPTASNNHDQPELQDVIYTTFKMSDPIHQRDISQSTLVSLNFISYFNSHFYTSIVIVTTSPLPLLLANEANTHKMHSHISTFNCPYWKSSFQMDPHRADSI